MIQKELNIRSAVIHKIIHELPMKKLDCPWVTHDLTEHQKSEHIRICRETLKLLNNGKHYLISKIINDDETCIPFFDVPTHQKSKIWVFEDDPKPIMMKKQ